MRASGARHGARRLARWGCGALVGISIALLVWGFWQTPRETKVLYLDQGQGSLGIPDPPSANNAIAPSPNVTLEYPSSLRVGDIGLIRLRLTLDAKTALLKYWGDRAEDADAYAIPAPDRVTALAEANLELPQARIRPSDSISQALRDGAPTEFVWSASTSQPGELNGTAWLFIKFATNGTEPTSRIALSAQPIQIEAATFLGLGGAGARLCGTVGVIAAAMAALPIFGGDRIRVARETSN